MKYQAEGMRREQALQIASLTKHQYYHQPSSTKNRGRPPSTHTRRKHGSDEKLLENAIVIADMMKIDADPDLSCGAKRMTSQLQLLGYIISRPSKSIFSYRRVSNTPKEIKQPLNKID